MKIKSIHAVECPRCQKDHYIPYGISDEELAVAKRHGFTFPALSRFDNKTDICSNCGTDEAMRDFSGEALTGPEDWPVK